jgi:hypothetical protein
MAGSKGKCPSCGHTFSVPARALEQAPASSARPAKSSPRDDPSRASSASRKPTPPPAPPRNPPAPPNSAARPSTRTASPKRPAKADDDIVEAEPVPEAEVVEDPAPKKRKKSAPKADDNDTFRNEDFDPTIDPAYRKKKKKRKPVERMDRVIPSIDNYVLGLSVLGVLWIVLSGLSLLIHPLSLAVIGLGGIALICGNVWFRRIVAEEGVAYLMFIPGYQLYFSLSRWHDTWKPLLLNLVGGIIVVTGFILAIMTNSLPWDDELDHHDPAALVDEEFADDEEDAPRGGRRGRGGR